MKTICLLMIAWFVCTNLFSQSGFSYQGVLRKDGKLRINEQLNLTVYLIQSDKDTVYKERQSLKTNAYGVFSMIIGQGTRIGSADFSPSLFLNIDSTAINTTELVVKEGNSLISKTQILGVPFAEVAKVALKASIDFPAGTIIAFGGDTTRIPKGWILCDGRGLETTKYRELFDAISNSWGGNGNLFRIPDLRGVFLRGVNYKNGGSYSDPDTAITARNAKYLNGNSGNKVGSYQVSMFASHVHDFKLILSEGRGVGTNHCFTSPRTTPYPTEPTGGSETRPVNAYVNYIIKY